MKRTGLLTFLVAAACAAEPRATDPKDPGDPASPPNQMHGITLTAAAPRQDLEVAPPATAMSLTLTIAMIENPASQAFSLAASIAGAGQVEAAIGSVTPFPATQPGSFVLGLPEAVRARLARATGPQTLRLSLQPIAADRPLAEPLRVTVGDPVWR
jgi:hypothetical protein